MDTDPVTGAPIPKEAIQRVLHISPKVHIYKIPPITSTKGFAAAPWTQNPADQIFTTRLRIIETAIPSPAGSGGEEKVSVHILLEDPKTGELFAAAPYTATSVVEQANDSARFFAIRVVGDGGKMRATLGMGFEERPEAFDFSVSLQDVRRTLGMDGSASSGASGARGGRRGPPVPPKKQVEEVKRDFSLKEGEMITINIGGKGRRTISDTKAGESATGGGLFSIAPPPGTGSAKPFLPPPPSAADVRAGKSSFSLAPPPSASDVRAEMESKTRQAQQPQSQPSAEELGFDDGEFGEFQ